MGSKNDIVNDDYVTLSQIVTLLEYFFKYVSVVFVRSKNTLITKINNAFPLHKY